jgi:NADH-quinone oxidoreductase subunit M
MHNRPTERAASREIGVGDALVIVPLVLAIIAFALYPQGALRASEPAVKASIQEVVK